MLLVGLLGQAPDGFTHVCHRPTRRLQAIRLRRTRDPSGKGDREPPEEEQHWLRPRPLIHLPSWTESCPWRLVVRGYTSALLF